MICLTDVRQETFLTRKNGGFAVLIWGDASGNTCNFNYGHVLKIAEVLMQARLFALQLLINK